MTFSNGSNLAELRVRMGLRPMAEFDPSQPACIYDNLNEAFFDWDMREADHYRQWAKPYTNEGYEELTDYDGLELLGWYAV
jgi:hypothetical protein